MDDSSCTMNTTSYGSVNELRAPIKDEHDVMAEKESKFTTTLVSGGLGETGKSAPRSIKATEKCCMNYTFLICIMRCPNESGCVRVSGDFYA